MPLSIDGNLAEIPAPCTGPELLASLSEKRMYRVSPCLFFSRAAFLRENHISFYPGVIHEDNLYTFTCILLAQRAFKLDEVFYCRRMRPNSTMTSALSFDNVYGSLKCLIEMLAVYQATQSRAACSVSSDAVKSVFGSMQVCLQRYYHQISDEEKAKAQSLEPMEQFYLKFFAQQPIRTAELLQQNRRLTRELDARNRSLQRYQTEVSQIRRSFTYRIGRVITWLPRMIRKILQK